MARRRDARCRFSNCPPPLDPVAGGKVNPGLHSLLGIGHKACQTPTSDVCFHSQTTADILAADLGRSLFSGQGGQLTQGDEAAPGIRNLQIGDLGQVVSVFLPKSHLKEKALLSFQDLPHDRSSDCSHHVKYLRGINSVTGHGPPIDLPVEARQGRILEDEGVGLEPGLRTSCGCSEISRRAEAVQQEAPGKSRRR
jgi:hypothetical protein